MKENCIHWQVKKIKFTGFSKAEINPCCDSEFYYPVFSTFVKEYKTSEIEKLELIKIIDFADSTQYYFVLSYKYEKYEAIVTVKEEDNDEFLTE